MELVRLFFAVVVIHFQVMAASVVTLRGITDSLKPEHVKYAEALQIAAASFREADELFTDEAFITKKGWKKDGATEDGDFVFSKHSSKGKIVTVSTVLDGSVDKVMHETWTGVPGLPKWNPNIDYASIAVSLTDHADILHYGNNDILVVTGRDFVSARIYRPLSGGGYLMTSRSVNVTDIPLRKDKVRANLHLAAARFRPDPSSPESRTLCDVVMLVDLKGMLPKLVVSQTVPKIMIMDIEQNKKHFHDLADKSVGKDGVCNHAARKK